MKKTLALFGIFLFFIGIEAFAAAENQRTFSGTGTVTNVSPLNSRISIDHSAIKGFAEAGETEFFVNSKDLIADIHGNDIVSFEIVDTQGDVKIVKITQTGIAELKEKGLPVGKTVQGVLKSTGDAVNSVTEPIHPVNEVANSAMGATTQTTGSVLDDASTDSKKNF